MFKKFVGMLVSLVLIVYSAGVTFAEEEFRTKPMVSVGSSRTVALKSDGTVWCRGYNKFGQLGDGTTEDRSIPVQVKGLTEIVAVAAGADVTVALKSDGTIWHWGYSNI